MISGKVPNIVANPGDPTAWIEPDTEQPLTFHAVGQSQSPKPWVPLYRVIPMSVTRSTGRSSRPRRVSFRIGDPRPA